jgi:iron complex outermembrane receptor protein
MKHHRFKPATLALAVMGALSALGAQAAHAEDAKELPTISVSGERQKSAIPLDLPAATGSRLGTTIREIPASVDVISQELMQERGDRTMIEAVGKVTGMTGGRVGGSHVAFSARGFIENGVTWLYNGVRVPGSSNFSSRVLDTANYDRIEVLRGPAAVLNGEGGTGATINLISRAPSFDKQPFELDYAFSSYNSHRLHAGTGGAIKEDAVAYRADISTNRFGSNVHGERTELDRFTGSLLFKLSNTLKLTLELDRLHDDVEDLYYGTPLVNGRISKSLRRINYNNLTDNKYKSDTTWLRANLEWQVAPDVEVRNQAYYYDSFRDWRDVDDFTYIAGATPKVRRNTWADLDHDHQLVGNRLDALFKGTLAGMDNRFVVGTDINRTNFKTKRNGFPAGTEAPVDAYNPPSVSLSSGTSVFKTLARDVTIEQWSIFAEDQLSLTSKLKLVGGFRHDNFKTNWTYFDQAGAPKESKAHTFNSWRAGVVYDLMPDTTVYASYATAVEPGGSLVILNRNQSQLDLTTAKQFELGVKQGFWGGKGEWTAAAYDIEKRNVFVPDPARPTNRLAVGQQSSRGLEHPAVAVLHHPGPVGRLHVQQDHPGGLSHPQCHRRALCGIGLRQHPGVDRQSADLRAVAADAVLNGAERAVDAGRAPFPEPVLFHRCGGVAAAPPPCLKRRSRQDQHLAFLHVTAHFAALDAVGHPQALDLVPGRVITCQVVVHPRGQAVHDDPLAEAMGDVDAVAVGAILGAQDLQPVRVTVAVVVVVGRTGTTPAAIPAAIAPAAAGPAGKLGTIHPATFGVFKGALATGAFGVDAQHLDAALVRVGAEGLVAQDESLIPARQLTQAPGHVHIAFGGAIERLQDAVVALLAILIAGALTPAGGVAVAIPPGPAAPALELGTIHPAAFRVFKGAVSPARTDRLDAQGLDAPLVRVGAKHAIAQAEALVTLGQLLEARGHVDMPLRRAVKGLDDAVIAFAPIGGSRIGKPGHQDEKRT